MNPTTLVLWDIDRTLMWADGSGEKALVTAAKHVFQKDLDLTQVPYSGRTDRWIANAIAKHLRIEPNLKTERAFLDCYIENLGINLSNSEACVLPGVESLLEIFDQDESICQALLTGNIAVGAKLKLNEVGLWDYFAFGAFADHSPDRNDLSPHALVLAKQHLGYDIDRSKVFVIGDTPHDIECGKVISSKTIAVATGCHPSEELATHNPDLTLESLDDHDLLLETIKDFDANPC